jgi:outer membrane protein assembly factor BamB
LATTTCTCGTTLPAPDALGLVTCPSCGRVIKGDDPTPDPPPSVGKPPDGGEAWPAPPVIAPTPGAGAGWTPPGSSGGTPAIDLAGMGNLDPGRTVSKAIRFGRGCSIGITVLIFLGVIIGIVIAVAKGKDAIDKAFNSTSDDITIFNSGSVVATQDGDPTDITVVVQHYDSSAHRYIARLAVGPDGFTEQWRSPELPGSTSGAQVAVVGDTLFAAFDDRLWALDRETGEQRWTTFLRDRVTSGCASCVTAVEGKLVVRTTDSWLTGFAPDSQEPAWSRRLVSPSATVSSVGGHLYVADDSAEQGQPSRVHTINPADGRDRRSVALGCPADQRSSDAEVEPDTVVHAVPGTKDLVAAFGFGSVCVVRWEASTGRVRFAAKLPESATVDQGQVVVGERDIAIGGSSGVGVVSLADGRVRALPEVQDEDASPGAIVGRTLVTSTTTTRGTRRGGLAGWDLDSGQRLWSVQAPGGAQPASVSSSDALFEGQPRSVLVSDGLRLRLVVFDGGTRNITVTDVDPRTGDLGRRISDKLGDRGSGTPSIAIEAIGTTRIVFTVDTRLHMIDLAGGGLAKYPS